MKASASRYQQAFPGHHAVLPVIHVDTLEQAQRNAQIAREAGADGAFLINHGMADEALLDIHAAVAGKQTGRDARVPGCVYFGGVAFKYQRHVEDLEAACRVAARYMDVVTTSGPGTGHAAEVEKIRRMKQTLGSTPLGIASGIAPENIGHYLAHADCFLVATGISRSLTELDPARVLALVQRVARFNGQ
ncbi:MAG: hypothetical protein HYV63_07490 [Candidatus Schekmanbacteria bacterium]|nr:hypothetical protein [Candidatus Schekmanbacteria bacterium]